MKDLKTDKTPVTLPPGLRARTSQLPRSPAVQSHPCPPLQKNPAARIESPRVPCFSLLLPHMLVSLNTHNLVPHAFLYK